MYLLFFRKKNSITGHNISLSIALLFDTLPIFVFQVAGYKQLAFLGFVGEGLFHGLYWKKPYLCNRNREAEGSAQAGYSEMQRQIKEL